MSISPPTNSSVGPLLTDMYQLTMAYAYWKQGKSEDYAVFDVFFRKNPFKGEFCIFAGQDEVLRYISSFRFSSSDISYLRHSMPNCDPNYFNWLASIDCSKVKVYAIRDGSVVFPRVPLIRIEGPLAIVQLLETTILNLVNFPSLIATNAARMRIAIGHDKKLLEFGLRRAQGPDGGLSASKYSYIGGFDGTSNLTAGKLFGLGVSGTHAHSFVMSYKKLSELKSTKIIRRAFFEKRNNSKQPSTSCMPEELVEGEEVEFLELVFKYRKELDYELTNEGELAAFVSYAQSFPTTFLALLDTYDILASGLHNFIVVALALREIGYKPLGIRIDSGDLAYLSKKIREKFKFIDSKYPSTSSTFSSLNIVASNDISEKVLHSLNSEGHSINTFGIGTNLVTCQSQPALGCVFKLVENNNEPRIKLSQESEKMVIPCKKRVFRLYNSDRVPLLDVLTNETEEMPKVEERLLVHHPFDVSKRAYVTPKYITELLEPIFDGKILYPERLYPNNWFEYLEEDKNEKESVDTPLKKRKIDSEEVLLVKKQWDSLQATRTYCQRQIKELREDHIRTVNPTPYKVSVSSNLYKFIHDLRMSEHPAELI